MTVLERLKAAGYDPAMSLFPDRIGKAGSMECERIQIRTFFCRPRENEAAIGVTATAMTHFSDGSTRPYPDGWPRSLEASVTLYFAGDAEFHYFGNVATDLVGSDAEFRYAGLMENVARYDDKVRPVLLRVHRLKIKAAADVLKAGILSADLRPGETADVPVSGVQYFQHHISSLSSSLMMSSSLPRRAASARDFAP